MTAPEVMTCLGLVLVPGVLTWRQFCDVSDRLREQERDVIDIRMRCPEPNLIANLDARLIGLESKLDHMTRLLSTLVEIRNGKAP